MGDTTESEFLIKIRTALEGAGIKATDDQAKALGESLEDTGKKGTVAHEKIEEGAHKSELSHRELRESLGAVAAQFGGLADVGLWLNPMTAALAATLFLVDKVREYFKNAAEAVTQLAEQTDKINESKIKGFADAANSAAESLAAMAVEQEKLNTAYNQSSTAMDNRLKQYDAERDAVLKVAEAKEGAFEAEMHYQVELGNISKENADAAIAQAKLKLDSQRGAADSAKLEMEIEERKQELAKASFRLRAGSDEGNYRNSKADEGPLTAAANASDEAAKQAATGSFQSTFTNWRGSKEGFNGTIEELKKRIQTESEGQDNAASQNMPEIADRYQHDKEALQEILKSQQKYVENLQHAAELDKQKLNAAKAQTDQAAEQMSHDQEILRSGQDRIDQLQKQLELQQQVTREVELQHHITAELNARTAAHQEQTRVLSGKGTDQEQADFEDGQTRQFFAREGGGQAANDASGAISTGRNILANMRGQRPSQDQMAEVKEILNTIAGLQENSASELNSQRSGLSDVRRRLENLESQSMNNRFSP